MFLERVVKDVLQNYAHIQTENIIFIVPNKRAVLFLKKYFAKEVQSPCFSPEFISISEFIEQFSGLSIQQNMSLLFSLYKTYLDNCQGEPDPFEIFMGWGQTLLQDFNEIDQYLIDPKTIFPYIVSVKEIEHWSVNPERTDMQEKHLAFWNELGNYYYQFTEKMRELKSGYRGFVYREAIPLVSNYIQKSKEKLHIFAGFNALTKCEETIIQQILMELPSEIYFDIDKEFLEKKYHDAGLFIRRYLNDWKHFKNKNKEFKWKGVSFSEPKQLKITGVPMNINQAHFVGQCIQELSPEDWQDTAIILADEQLLLPILQAVDTQQFPINITMGFPLKQTPLSDLFASFFRLYFSGKWYFKEVENLLLHPVLQGVFTPEYTEALLHEMREKNWTYLSERQVYTSASEEDKKYLQLLFFSGEVSAKRLIENSLTLLKLLKEKIEDKKMRNELLLEYLYRFHQLFLQLEELQKDFSFISSVKSLYLLYNDLLLKQTLDFQGEPLQGLQLMGMLESQNLDFKHIIMVSVNEEILPAGKNNNSLIPYDIKMNLGLPTYKLKDAIFTYHFYRLLQRAESIHLIYNSEANGMKSNEPSRFILQLLSERYPHIQITKQIAAPHIQIGDYPKLEIKKDSHIMEKLNTISEEKGFSPTALSSYIRNPITFYERVILDIREEIEVEEDMEHRTFGTILHNVLEDLYKKYKNKILTSDSFDEMKGRLEERLKHHFEEQYKEDEYLLGKDNIIFSVIKEYIERFLEMEREISKKQAIKVLHTEYKLSGKVVLPLRASTPSLREDKNILGEAENSLREVSLNQKEEGYVSREIHLIGKVDRIDERDGKIYIIDYKTGLIKQSDLNLTDKKWENLLASEKGEKPFQLLVYAYLLNQMELFKEKEIIVGNYCFRNFGEGFLELKKKVTKESDEDILYLFENKLKDLLSEIFNQEKPFTEK